LDSRVSVVGLCGCGVHWTDFFTSSYKLGTRFSRVSLLCRRRRQRSCYTFLDVVHLFCLVLCVFCYIVFIWLSTQGKRKLWLRVSMVTGREPS
jgi:hypothetical protein